MDFVPISRVSAVFRFGSRCSFFRSRIAYRASAGADRSDLLIPFVAPHVLIVSVILVIVERSSFSWSSVSLCWRRIPLGLRCLFFFYPMIGLRRFLYPHHAMSGFAIVCGELTGMARMPMIDGRRSHLIISSCGSVLRCLLACGSSFHHLVPSHRPSSRSSPPRSSTRLGGA